MFSVFFIFFYYRSVSCYAYGNGTYYFVNRFIYENGGSCKQSPQSISKLEELATVNKAFLFVNMHFFLSRQSSAQKTWVQPLSANLSPYRPYQYSYSPYEQRKLYQLSNGQYAPAEMVQQSVAPAPIPISVPAGAALTPVSLQHVQLVPCMCPVAPEEADKLHDQLGPGPYVAQTYTQPSYSVPQQIAVADNNKPNKQ